MIKEQLTPKALQVLALAKKEAQHLKTKSAGTEHLLLGLLDSPSKTIHSVLIKYGATIQDLKQSVYDLTGTGDTEIKDFDSVALTPRVSRLVTKAITHAKKLSVEKAEVEHLFYMLLKEEGGVASTIFQAVGIDPKDILKEFKDYVPVQEQNIPEVVPITTTTPNTAAAADKKAKAPTRKRLDAKFLNAYANDLTQMAFEKKLEILIGREAELDQIIEVLCQKSKNNPILIGEAGVGKTAIVEGLAYRIVSGQVPEKLKNKYLYSLDITQMIAGTKFRGQFEERAKGVLNDCKHFGNVILFIDEAHQVVGAGSSDRVCDLGNMLKPALARSELSAIAATTSKEYKATIEKDTGLQRRFRTILIKPPTVDETINILKGIKHQYEEGHKVTYEPASLPCIATLTDRFITLQELPDKAIDILDAVGTRKRMTCDNDPKVEPIVTEDDVRDIISKRTGIPNYKLEDGQKQIMSLQTHLTTNVIGQDQATIAIVNTLKRAYANLRDINRPVGSFLFLGQTGVGKTQLCKELAKHLFQSESNLIHLDMSEFSEKHTASGLIGAPPGYMNAEAGGRLTEAVKRKPYSVVLFDEIEKAHPDVWNMLLQILEEGRLTDRSGTEVNFKNTIVVMTSNIGAEALQSTSGVLGFGTTKANPTNDRVLEDLRKTFRPEMINRIDEIVIFNKLTKANTGPILDIFLTKYIVKLKELYNCTLTISQEVKDFLILKGFSDKYGARELRRVVTGEFETPLSDILLLNAKSVHRNINANLRDGKVIFTAAD